MSYINNLNNELRYSYKKVLRRDLVEIKVSRKYKQSGSYGGIKDRNDTKLDSSLRRAKRRIIDIIDYNLVPNSIMVTLTYKENFQDYVKSYHHFKNFIKRLNMPKYLQVQDLNRPYKLLRELQTDFSIRAVKTSGWGLIWNAIPFLNMITTTKYIYYENTNAAVNGLLPFNAKSLINETLKHGYLTSGQATKETYEATNGLIRYGRVWQRKKMVNYDTRYFHKLVYGKSYHEYTQEHLKKNL